MRPKAKATVTAPISHHRMAESPGARPNAAFSSATAARPAVTMVNPHDHHHESWIRCPTRTMNNASPKAWMPATRIQASPTGRVWPNTVETANRGTRASAAPTDDHTAA